MTLSDWSLFDKYRLRAADRFLKEVLGKMFVALIGPQIRWSCLRVRDVVKNIHRIGLWIHPVSLIFNQDDIRALPLNKIQFVIDSVR